MSAPPRRHRQPGGSEPRATLVPRTDEPEDDLDPLAAELLRQIRTHNADELKVNSEGFDGLRAEFAGMRQDFGRLIDRLDRSLRAMLWLVGAVVVVSLVAVVAVAGAQINANGFGMRVGTGEQVTITDRKADLND